MKTALELAQELEQRVNEEILKDNYKVKVGNYIIVEGLELYYDYAYNSTYVGRCALNNVRLDIKCQEKILEETRETELQTLTKKKQEIENRIAELTNEK